MEAKTERRMYLNLLPVEEARALWFDRLDDLRRSLAPEAVPLKEALGRTAAEPIAALRSSPAFHGAAMDGVAVKAEATFQASPRSPLELAIGKDAFWVNTGHPLPEGTNAVIMVEKLERRDDKGSVVITQAAFPWQHVRKLGEDMVATEIILAPGTVIGPAEIGALAAAGVMRPLVYRRPRVAILPTGSEIAPLESLSEAELASGKKLPEFNSLVFSAQIQLAGGDAQTLPIVPDDPERIRTALEQAAKAGFDMIVVNAGSSAGSRDYTEDALAALGEVFCHGIAVMPGKPALLGRIGSTPVVGAPGYPVSASIAMEEFVLPWLCRLQSRELERGTTVMASPCNPLPSKPGMEERVRVKLGLVDGKFRAVPLARGAGVVSSLSRADGILAIPASSEGIDAGMEVPVRLVRPRRQIEDALLAVGSHDNALDLIDSFLRRRHPRFRLTSAHVGSLGGLTSLAAGQSHLAGSHLLDEATGVYNRKAIAEKLAGIPCTLVHLAQREQGFMVKPGNPLGIRGVEDLAREGLRFVNRQRGSGTRVLLDYRLKLAGIAPAQIAGYRDKEFTHMAVAAAVLSGRADTGLGIRASARALGLDFIPLGPEEYDLVIPSKYMQDERILALMDVISSAEFRRAVDAMGGYGTEQTGQVLWEFAG